MTEEFHNNSPMSRPLISVIIPTYNRLELLKLTLESVRNQTFGDFEIIVVDDGSSDGTGEWLSRQDDLITLRQKNAGIATSRNNGIAAAKGEWVAFLDHDDLWAQDKLQIQADFIKAHPDHVLVAAKHVRLGKGYSVPRKPVWIKGDLFVDVFSKSFIHTSSVIIRKDIIKSIGGFPSKYGFADEFQVWLKIAHDHPIGYFDKPLVFIRFYESNTSHNRIGVRTDTYDILMNNYDPLKIPRKVYLKTMSDHDISFGRAYIAAGDTDTALGWFKRSFFRAPWRLRGARYYLKYLILTKLKPKKPENK